MYSHLVSIKIRIEGSTDKWVYSYSLSFYQNRLKSLNTKPVKCWCPVQKYGMVFYYLIQHLPYLRRFLFYHLLCTFDSCGISLLFQHMEYKGFKKLQSHLFWKATLMKFKFRTNNNNCSA